MLKRLIPLFLLAFLSINSQAQSEDVSARHPHLQRGINLPFWFWYAPANPERRFEVQEFHDLRASGIDFVRVPIDLSFIMTGEGELNPQHLALIDTAIEQLHGADLAVIIDLHSTSLADSNAANYSGALEDPEFVAVFVQFWRNFASHLSQYPTELTYFGLMNEPVFYDNPEAWLPIQEELVRAVREVAPEHTLMVTGAHWSNIDTLIQLEPLDDDNLIYEFHFYDPFPFTHQGATWAGTPWQELRNIPYPSSSDSVAPLLDGLSQEAQDAVAWYGQEGWNREKVAERLNLAIDWGREHDVFLLCGEFGAYSNFAPAADRAGWIQDVREILEENHVAWAMWEYDNSFGLVDRRPSGRGVNYDEAIVNALGLQMP